MSSTQEAAILCVLLFLFPLATLAQNETDLTPIESDIPQDFSSSYFPRDFLWGASSAAYQYEGETNKSCRGPSVWDTFTYDHPNRIEDGSDGSIAVDFYHRYKDDLNMLKDLNMNAFRFSISWSRLVPSGKVHEGVNQNAIKFYNDLLDYLHRLGIVPYVTLFHFDTPQALEDKYGSFFSFNIVHDFQDYADFCFKTFGEKVKYWVTFNEPHTFSIYSYDMGSHAPGRCSNWVDHRCLGGDSATEPYNVSHNLLVAHAKAVNVYRTKYQATQKGKIGIVLNCDWMEPYSSSTRDQDASKRALDFELGWFLDPVTYGDYPTTMIQRVGNRLTPFTESQSTLLRGSYDFLGLNYYTANYVQDYSSSNPLHVRALTDSGVKFLGERDGVPIGPSTAFPDLKIVPWGIKKLLEYIKDTYKNPEIHVTENGMDHYDNGSLTWPDTIRDPVRKEFYRNHIWFIYRAMNESNVVVKGFLLWSLLDNYEWSNGYPYRFGIVYVDYKNSLARYYRDSALWFWGFLNNRSSSSPKIGSDHSITEIFTVLVLVIVLVVSIYIFRSVLLDCLFWISGFKIKSTLESS